MKLSRMTKAEYLEPVFKTFSDFWGLDIQPTAKVLSLSLDSCKRLNEVDALERKYQTPRGEHVRLLETWIVQQLNEGK